MIPGREANLPRAAARASEGGSAPHLRRLNLDRVLAFAMRHPEPFTRAQLIDATGLSAPTVGSLVGHLIRTGVVRHLGTGPSRGGRRPSFMEFNARHGYVVGIDIAPVRTRIAVADLRGERLAHRELPTPSDAGPAALLSRVAAGLRSLLKEAGVPPDRLLGVAAGAPGAVDRERGIVVALAPNLSGWSDVPMAAMLEGALGAPVVAENDVNLAVLGEHWRGAARGHGTCAFISVGMGIGAGILLGGELHRGHRFLAGEIALMCMGPQFVSGDFGSHGCLESLAALPAVAGRWPSSEPTDPEQRAVRLVEAARQGDRDARRAIEEAGTFIGIAAANLSLVLDPSLIVLGGPMAIRGGCFAEQVQRTVARILPVPTAIEVSALGSEAVLWGSLLVALQEARARLRSQVRAAAVPA